MSKVANTAVCKYYRHPDNWDAEAIIKLTGYRLNLELSYLKNQRIKFWGVKITYNLHDFFLLYIKDFTNWLLSPVPQIEY
jgi:hypothetical protein